MNEPAFDDFAWAVGLFEGEGSIDTVRSANGRRRVYARVRLNTTDEDVLLRFVAIVGAGRSRGPVAQHEPGRKPQWYWEIAGHAANQFLHRALPHLGARRAARAREVLEESGALIAEGQGELLPA